LPVVARDCPSDQRGAGADRNQPHGVRSTWPTADPAVSFPRPGNANRAGNIAQRLGQRTENRVRWASRLPHRSPHPCSTRSSRSTRSAFGAVTRESAVGEPEPIADEGTIET
jgi:hypothetical protein